MKKFFLIPVLSSILLLNLASTCSSDDDSNPSSSQLIIQTQNSIVSGSWRVTLFSEDGVVQTSNYNGYNFTFNANATVEATNGTTVRTGTWTTGTDDSTPKLILTFTATTGPFEEISEDWRIVSVTSSRIELRHVSGGDGSIDLLTFQKN
ncbi:hypothetical protein [Flavobacterium sp.]|uniref:hypothetical protein n=1 Tax=Flavobacterium sp. TaxID=239 RepID=UPI002FD94D2B